MKIDSHQHFWYYNDSDYGWISETMTMLKRDFLPADIQPEIEKAGFSGTIAVQARQSHGETRWLLKLAEENDFIKGVVGWVDLQNETLLKEQLDEFSESPKFVGVRHVVHDEPDNNFMLKEDFLRGISMLSGYGLTYDLLIFPRHLRVAEQLVSIFPDQKFILDHIAKPHIKTRRIQPWKEGIFNLARHGNVLCKLSGMVTEADWQNSKPEDFYPYLDIIFDAFGNERLMIGSDWPVCLLGGSYSYVTGIVKDYISEIPGHIQNKILGENCAEIYNLPL